MGVLGFLPVTIFEKHCGKMIIFKAVCFNFTDYRYCAVFKLEYIVFTASEMLVQSCDIVGCKS